MKANINKIVIEKTDKGIDIEFIFTNDIKYHLTDLNQVELKCENNDLLLTEFSTHLNSPRNIHEEVLKELSELLNKIKDDNGISI